MADFTALKTAIQTYIKQNGNEEIKGDILQEILLSVVTTLGDSAINDLITALADEVAARQNADGTLQQNITNEATARGNADTALGGRIDDEATARANGDTALSDRLGSTITAENTAADQIGAEAEARAAADTALQELIDGITENIVNGYVYAGIATPSSTPTTGKVFYLALTAGTYTNFGNTEVSQGINILKYNGSAWSLDAFIGIDDTPTPNSPNLVKSGGVAEELALGAVYDVSAKNPTAGPNNDGKWESLSALLSDANLNTLIPTAVRKGGMSIKFVRTSDNKYLQYRLTSQNFSTIVSDWQDVSSVSVSDVIALRTSITDGYYIDLDTKELVSNSVFSYCDYIPVYKGARLLFYNTILSDYPAASGAYYDINKTALSTFSLATMGVGVKEVIIPENARYVRLSIIKADKNNFFAGIDYSPSLASVDHPQDILDDIASNTQKADDATTYTGIYGKLSSTWMTSGKGINASTGAIENKGFTYTNERFIRCVPGEKIYSKLRTFTGNLELAFYTEAKESTFQSGIEGDDEIHERVTTVPSGCYYFRYSSIELGSACYLYYNVEAKLYNIDKEINDVQSDIAGISTDIGNIQSDIDAIQSVVLPENDIPFTFKNQKDIFANTGGESGFGTTSWATDFVDIHKYAVIEFLDMFTIATTVPSLGCAFYDSQKNYIGGTPRSYGRLDGVGISATSVKIIVPKGAYYFRTSIPDSRKSEFYIKGYNKIDDGFGLVYGAYANKAISNSLSVGDTVALSDYNAVMSFRIPTFGAKGMYIPTYIGSTSYIDYVVVDADGKILAKGSNTVHDEKITYVNLTSLEDADAVWFTTYYNEEMCSHVYYNFGNFLINKGSKVAINSISNSELIGKTTTDDSIYNVNVVNNSTDKVVTIDFQGQRYSNINLFAKINGTDNIAKLDTVLIQYYIGTTKLYEFSVDAKAIFQTNDWAKIESAKMSGHTTTTLNKIILNFTFDSQQTSDSNFDLQLCGTFLKDTFHVPVLGVNFDHTWEASETCGAYDDLLDNNIPFTITGGWNITTAIGNKMMAAYSEGLVDIGKYGGNTDPDGLMISTSVDYADLMTRIAECIDYRYDSGIDCVSFGGGSHHMSSRLLRALLVNEFEAVRVGATGVVNINIIPKNRKGIVCGGTTLYLANGSIGILFAHGISSNPSGETDPSLYMNYTTFKAIIDAYLALKSNGGAIALNLKQISALRSQYDLFGMGLIELI